MALLERQDGERRDRELSGPRKLRDRRPAGPRSRPGSAVALCVLLIIEAMRQMRLHALRLDAVKSNKMSPDSRSAVCNLD